MDISSLIRSDQVRHRYDLRIVLIPMGTMEIDGLRSTCSNKNSSEQSKAKKKGEKGNERLGLLRIKRVDLTPHQHIGKNEVLEDLDSLRRPRLVELLERLEEVCRSLRPILYKSPTHMHRHGTHRQLGRSKRAN
jgi:hypothetical protein